MQFSEESGREAYRVIVFRGDGTETLLRSSDEGLHFPQVTIPQQQRIAENVTIAMKERWGKEIVCLFELDSPLAGQDNSRYVAAEHWRTSGDSAVSLQWVSVNDLGQNSFAESADYFALRNSLDHASAAVRDGSLGTFARLHWFEELYDWVGRTIAPRTLRLTGNFRQLNASPSFSLIRFETNGPAVWFKAVGEPNQREFPMTHALARLLPTYVPEVLGVRASWNGWLMSEVHGENLVESTSHLFWHAAASALAKLQIASMRSLGELAGCGAHDLGVRTLRELVSPFISDAADLMKKQSKTPPRILDETELMILEKRLRQGLCILENLKIPNSLGHLDLNPANLIVSGDSCVFLDWAEAYVGHPFFACQYLLEHFRHLGADFGSQQQLVSSYLAPWEQIAPRDRVAEAAEFAPMLAVFAYAVGSGTWTHPGRPNEPAGGYLRSLVRRMSIEAHKLNERRAPCLS